MTRPGAPLSHLLTRAVGAIAHAAPSSDETETRVLDAAIVVLARKGTREATMDDVAAESGVSRTTLFRRFAGKDPLFERALAREFSVMLDGLTERIALLTDPTEQLVEGFAAFLHLVHHHPLFGGGDPERRAELVQALDHGDPSPMRWGHTAVRAHLAAAQAAGSLPPGDPGRQADAVVHLTLGYVAAPSLVDDLADLATTQHLARIAITPILTGTAPAPSRTRADPD
ncbi:TetR/AcrR family transcriptional regulator [Nocardia asteroides]|uniref:TetR/AcrR family transcriptional regulator n=1 Tax=Nocardia asteroides TaxID=1824 RepID=UPI001E5C5024|nr:TetR/AcrR family transcriptional regulator [Nocardia asteroides]UGT61020.1 TetR/AcrR family transcriptional regulator [Nocardia asteroides]